MDYQAENIPKHEAPVTKPANKLVAAAAGLAGGFGSMVLFVNHSITSNMRKIAEPGFNALEKYKKQLKDSARKGFGDPGEHYAASLSMHDSDNYLNKLRENIKRRFTSAMHAHAEPEIRRELTNREGMIAKAMEKAGKGNRLADNPQLEFVTQMIADAASADSGDPHTRRMLNNIETLVIDLEKKEMEKTLRRMPSHVPLKERLSFAKELHLTDAQKAGTYGAFAVGAAVTAGAVYYGLKQHARNKQLREEQQQALLGIGF